MRPGTPRRNPTRGGAAPDPATVAAMTGAVDLAAVKARSEAATRAADAPAPAPGNYVVDITEATFQSEVLDRSFQVPVLIDLWADWCEPCKQLSPILERLANAAGGAWVLAKIDTEANPRVAQALQVQSIPTVYAVIGGQLIPGFQGALPEAQVREFVDAVLAAAREAGLPTASGPPPEGQDGEAPEPPEDPRFTAAEDALADGDLELAAQRYQTILAQEPANQEAALALGQVRLLQRLDNIDRDAAQRADSAPDDVDAQLAAADLAFANNDVSGALDRLLATVARRSGDDRERVRSRLLEYFELLGPDDPRVSAARRQLARSLF
jgi:putative thioredoxin